MTLAGIRVAGGCEVLTNAAAGATAFANLCTKAFGAESVRNSVGKLAALCQVL